MRVLHFALSCFYIEGYNYQENVLPRLHAKAGHTVMMIASCVSFGKDGLPTLVEPGRYQSRDGFEVVRLPYKKPFHKGLFKRLRIFPDVYRLIEEFRPDVMYFHGCAGWEIRTVARYKKAHPEVLFFADTHSDAYNSAHGFISRLQYRCFYTPVLKKALPHIEKVLCPSLEIMDFAREIYHIPASMLEFYPLGGIIPSDETRAANRADVRAHEQTDPSALVFLHSGKIDAKKRTADLIRGFSAVPGDHLRLWIIGVLTDPVKAEIESLASADSRIHLLGWKDSQDLQRYLCAADVYAQPGSQSATMQNAMCSGCAMLLYPHRSHQAYLNGNGLYVDTVEDIRTAIQSLADHPAQIGPMQQRSLEISREILDYEKMAARVLRK